MNISNLGVSLRSETTHNDFYAAVRAAYHQDIQAGSCAALEKEYDAACQKLLAAMQAPAASALFSQFLAAYEANRDDAARFGFRCGLDEASTQAFSGNTVPDGDFYRLVVRELFMLPDMKRQEAFYARLELAHKLECELSSLLSGDVREALDPIECALSNRVYHAALTGFYWGCQEGFRLLTDLFPGDAPLLCSGLQAVQDTFRSDCPDNSAEAVS